MDADEIISRVWRTARAICPELPETYEESRKPGEIFSTVERGRVMLLNIGVGGSCQVLTNDYAVVIMDEEDLIPTGETAPLMDIMEQYLTRRTRDADEPRGGQNKRAVEDASTGLTYESVTEWARKNGISRMSGYRLLNGEKEQIKGHRLEYLDG